VEFLFFLRPSHLKQPALRFQASGRPPASPTTRSSPSCSVTGPLEQDRSDGPGVGLVLVVAGDTADWRHQRHAHPRRAHRGSGTFCGSTDIVRRCDRFDPKLKPLRQRQACFQHTDKGDSARCALPPTKPYRRPREANRCSPQDLKKALRRSTPQPSAPPRPPTASAVVPPLSAAAQRPQPPRVSQFRERFTLHASQRLERGHIYIPGRA